MTETIFAQASAHGKAGIAVIRISGPRALAALAALGAGPPAPRTAALRWLRAPETGEPIDQALVLAFPAPASFTGEDVVELHLHGSPAVTRAALGALARQPGLRLAEPGEFTRRALTGGRLDLVEVEALADLIEAETEAQHRQALALMRGSLSQLAAGWRADLVRALALLEATIDFADEDIPEDLWTEAAALVSRVAASMRRELAGSPMAERIRDGFEVALVGAPNVGKSTLLNSLAGRAAALTSEVAGTTRDVIEVRMDLQGLPVTLLDMAGLRATEDRVEVLGVARARERAAAADLRIFLLDRGVQPPEIVSLRRAGDLVVRAKADLDASGAGPGVSGTTGAGVPDLLGAVARVLETRASGAGSVVRARQRQAIERSVQSLAAALDQLAPDRRCAEQVHAELAAADLQAALRALDFLVGRVDVEAVLDVIFASFCLGK